MTKLQLSFDDCCSNQTLDDGPEREELLKQYNRLQLEVDRWREECIQLHSILAKQTEGLKNVASINYGSHVHLKNEVVELVLAFEAQKKINRQLEDELHQEKNKWQAEREQLQQENEKLREENDNQHKLLSPSLTKSPQTQTEAFMQHEIIRVTSGKLVLQEKLDLAKEELPQCKSSLKFQTEVLKDQGYTDVPSTLQPIIQAAHLLQARMLDENVQDVCNMCDKLSMLQIIKILNLYTTIDESEECVPVSFIHRIQAKLLDTTEPQKQATMLMDTKFMFPVRFPFNPSKIKLEDIEVPEVLNLPMLKKV
ncbi:unconventional myosin-Va-like [Schistocerca americana]|uniref:unconventional myosin-Va-like n=1 Tax=Schistocerca americana TaxID=7009 RepID=UPI001F5027A4|nr:unconventional myosin-Va-like [Schistocerca americana]